jgi:Na+/melibiose symporter-like transporter
VNGNRKLYLIFIAMLMFAAAVVVLIQNQNLSTELLGSIAVLGSIAIVLTNITNGGPHD